MVAAAPVLAWILVPLVSDLTARSAHAVGQPAAGVLAPMVACDPAKQDCGTTSPPTEPPTEPPTNPPTEPPTFRPPPTPAPTDAPTTPPPTDAPTTPPTPAPTTPATQPPATQPPATSPPATEPPVTEPFVTVPNGGPLIPLDTIPPDTTPTTTIPGAPPPTTAAPTPGRAVPQALRTVPGAGITVATGGSLTAVGQGCDPGAPVVLTVAGSYVGTARADNQGNFAVKFLQLNLDAGRYMLGAQCGPTLPATPIDVVVQTGTSGPDVVGALLLVIIFVVMSVAVGFQMIR